MIRLQNVQRDVRGLAPLDTTAMRLLDLVFHDDVDIGRVVRLIRYDGNLVAQLLRLANSAAFSGGTPVSSIHRAVVRVGLGKVATLALTSSVSPRLRAGLEPYGLDEGELWRHSVAAAITAEGLARGLDGVSGDLAFASALLHDVGKTLLALYMDEVHRRDLADALRDGDRAFVDGERAVLGIDHAEVGGWVSEQWELPPEITAAIRDHHRPAGAASMLVHLVHVGDLVAKTLGIGNGAVGLQVEGVLAAAEHLDISGETFEIACARTAATMPHLEPVYLA